MDWVTIVWSMAASACLTLALVHLSIWIRHLRDPSYLLFALTALAAASIAAFELGTMHAQTIEEFSTAVRWTHLPVWILIVSLTWFVRLYFDAGRVWLAWTICITRTISLILNFILQPNLNFRAITGLRQVEWFAGAKVAVAIGERSAWSLVGVLSVLLLLAFLVDAMMTVWRRGDRQRALVLGGGMILFASLASGQGVLLFIGVIHTPSSLTIAYLLIVVAMSIGLGSDVLASFIDISQRRRAELEAQQQRNELAHLSRVTTLGELSGSLAHELNQPLTAILSNAQAAQRILSAEGVDLEEVREILKDIVDDDKRAGEVISRLNTLLKKGEVQMSALNLNDVVADVLRLTNHDMTIRSVTIATDLQPDLPMVIGDHVQLQQVLLNLIINGCDAMTREAANNRTLSAHTEWADRQNVRVCVKDHGCGIPPDRIESVFDPFFTTKRQGMGLGLTVCRTIITAHGGRLWASNNSDRGASLQFTLPAVASKGNL